MNFTTASAVECYHPRGEQDAPAELFRTRVEICHRCPLRSAHRCRIANQLVSILARPAVAVCPNRSWPGDPPALPHRTAAIRPA